METINALPLDYARPASPRRRRAVLALIVLSIVAAGSLSLWHAQPKPAPTPIPQQLIWSASGSLNDLHDALFGFEADTGRFPTQSEGLAALTTRPADVVFWDGPYVPQLPLDPWGKPYVYHASRARQASGDLVTCDGPDGVPNNADDVPRLPRSCGMPYELLVRPRLLRREALLRIATRLPHAFMAAFDLTATDADQRTAIIGFRITMSALDRALRNFDSSTSDQANASNAQ
jgi:type II secretion system protein G